MRYLSIVLVILFACQTKQIEKPSVEAFLDQWHQDAATGQLKSYFNAIHENGFFLGTDKTENWSKSAFYDFCVPVFEDGKAWDFKASARNVYFSEDGTFAWFDEVLDTWMGPCRGSGVLVSTESGWKIMQYNLTILVENEDVDAYLEILNKRENEQK